MIERQVLKFTAHADVDTDTDRIVRMVIIADDGERYVLTPEQLNAVAASS
jgi:hypothetical protein